MTGQTPLNSSPKPGSLIGPGNGPVVGAGVRAISLASAVRRASVSAARVGGQATSTHPVAGSRVRMKSRPS
jgi:hypothetical protein